MKRSKDLLLENLCLIETYKETFEDYGYIKENINALIEQLDKELSRLYLIMCDQKWDFDENDYK